MYLEVDIAFILISLLTILAAASSNHRECPAKLEALSPCLPVVSAPPTKCCDAIAVAFNATGSGDSCICHLLRQPDILGFPLNLSSVLSLQFLCETMPELSVECGESASELKEAMQKRYMVIEGSCKDTQCCSKVCKKRLPTTLSVIYRFINGAHLCFCHGT